LARLKESVTGINKLQISSIAILSFVYLGSWVLFNLQVSLIIVIRPQFWFIPFWLLILGSASMTDLWSEIAQRVTRNGMNMSCS